MNHLEKLEAIRSVAHIHDICFRNAGVGILFYEGPAPIPKDWSAHLIVRRYYPTLEEAIDAEWDRLQKDGKPKLHVVEP